MVTARAKVVTHGEGPSWVTTIRRIAEGDQGALGELYDATSPIVLGLITRIVGDPTAAEEIALDVYTQVWRVASSYAQEKGTPMTWLLMLARSRAIDHLRSRAMRAKEKERSLESAFGCAHPGPNPEMAAVAENRRRIVREALAALGAEQLEALRLAFFDGLSHLEIAEETGIPLGTIKSRIRTAMMRMRELLELQMGAL
jgi:RNA polymerase sigma-70 factor (ECF subfamily)